MININVLSSCDCDLAGRFLAVVGADCYICNAGFYAVEIAVPVGSRHFNDRAVAGSVGSLCAARPVIDTRTNGEFFTDADSNDTLCEGYLCGGVVDGDLTGFSKF